MELDTLILGAGAAGLFCAARTGGRTIVVDHARSPGEKIRISGGGRCNFTNYHVAPDRFLSGNPHFAKSALSRYTQWDFIEQVDRHGIAWHEKTLGQLFCDGSSKEIIAMLMDEVRQAQAQVWLSTEVGDVSRTERGFEVNLVRDGKPIRAVARSVVVAIGGKSIPKIGATGRAYEIAAQFGLPLVETRAGLVPLTFGGAVLEKLKSLAGVSVPSRLSCNGTSFDEGMLFTHRGLSGPSVLQVSSYWREGDAVQVALAPGTDILGALKASRRTSGRKAIATALGAHLPARLAALLVEEAGLRGTLADQSDKALERLGALLSAWSLLPSGSEGYRTAEVTLGGVSTEALSSKTMEARDVPGLYFIGECVDVTGWLGGYNFQWAWSSAAAAAEAIRAKV